MGTLEQRSTPAWNLGWTPAL